MSTSLKDLVPLVADDPPAEGTLVDAPEFYLTQVAKKLALTIPVFAAAVVGVLKFLGVEDATDPVYVVAALGVTAAGILALGIVAAADIIGRSYAAAAKARADVHGSTEGLGEEETNRLAAAAQAAREASDQDADAERKRLDRLAEEERQHLDRVAAEERERQDRVAEQKRTELNDERRRLDRVAEAERKRLDGIANDERERQDQVADEARRRLARLAEDERRRLDRDAEAARDAKS